MRALELSFEDAMYRMESFLTVSQVKAGWAGGVETRW